MRAKTKTVTLPSRVTSDTLAKYHVEGEPMVVLKVQGVGTTGAHEIHDKSGRAYIIRWSSKHGGHIIRIPARLWMQNNAAMAHSILDQHQHQFPLIPLIELSTTPQGGQAVSRQSHNLEIEGSTPSPETTQTEEDNSILEPIVPETPAAVLMYGEMPLADAIADLVKEGAVRIKAVAHQLDCSEEDVKTALTAPEASAEVANAGWVRLKAADTPTE